MERDANIVSLVRERAALGASLRFRVVSGSMAPLIQPGDEVVVTAVAAKALRPGDLVVAAAPGKPFVVHRLVALRHQGDAAWLVTRGDRSDMPDPPWPAESVIGRAVAVVRSGRTLDLTQGKGHRAIKLQGALARLEAATYATLRGAAHSLLGRRTPKLGWLARMPFRALARLISRMVT